MKVEKIFIMLKVIPLLYQTSAFRKTLKLLHGVANVVLVLSIILLAILFYWLCNIVQQMIYKKLAEKKF